MKAALNFRTIRVFLFSVLMFAFAAFAGYGQNFLQENQNYKSARDFDARAKQSFDIGEYEKAVEYSQKAQELSKIALAEAEQARLNFLAYNLKNRAAERVAYADKVKAQERFPDMYRDASAAFGESKSAYDAGAFQKSVDASRKVIALLKDLEAQAQGFGATAPKPAAAPSQPSEPAAAPAVLPQPSQPAAAAKPAAKTLPAYYKVRLIQSKRDCLWRIAGYDFVYGDSYKWTKLYEANKDTLPQPDNPDLIEPGIVLEIPSLAGETRSGIWEE
jgi:nucleoid-associated protein YgaU